MNKVALLVIYNHRFDKNIPRINEIYQKTFSHIYHLMPFYDGDEPNVIPVYEKSYYFQSYISQAYVHLKKQGFTHYFVISDDLILNPVINESNLWEVTGLPEDHCMLPRIVEFQKNRDSEWPRIKDAIQYEYQQKGLEIANILPSRDEAIRAFRFHGLSTDPLPRKAYRHFFPSSRLKKHAVLGLFAPKTITLSYPLVGAYSDICLITADCMQAFCSYCGAFAAGKLFVEVAIPTAMVLASEKISYIEDLKLKRGDMWTKAEVDAILEKAGASLERMLADFPRDRMYLHPIKLSLYR